MGERYWITGVQLAILQARDDEKARKRQVEEVIDRQFIGNFATDNDKARFAKQVNKLATDGLRYEAEQQVRIKTVQDCIRRIRAAKGRMCLKDREILLKELAVIKGIYLPTPIQVNL